MRAKVLLISVGIILSFGSASGVRADVLEMQNGDRYSGEVLEMSDKTVVLNSEILGKINVPRSKVARLTMGPNATPPKAPVNPALPASTNLAVRADRPALASVNSDLSTAFQGLGANTNFIGQIRSQMVGDNPEAAGKFDEMVSGLFSGQLNMEDLRRQAQSSAAQLRAFKREIAPEDDATLDGYLKILDAFINESAETPAQH